MKKYILILVCILMILMGTACGQTEKSSDNNNQEGINVVATVFPEYDWIRNIAGEDAGINLTLLLDKGVDLHSYQPTADDIAKVADCDLFVYVGGESDQWVEDALGESTNPDREVLCLMDALKDMALEEEIVEGMEGEEEEEEEEEGPEYDEHLWLSLKNAKVSCEKIAEALCRIDAENAEKYRSNLESYVKKLEALDQAYKEAVDQADQKVLLFGDRFPFRYMTEDYGIQYYAAFAGCSAETEASFETIKFLSEKVDELGLSCVMKIDGSDGEIADTIVANTKSKNQKVLAMDSMQSVTEDNASYISIMEKNLKAVQEALYGEGE